MWPGPFEPKPGWTCAGDEQPKEPMARRVVVNDVTVEKLGDLLEQNPWGHAMLVSELLEFLTYQLEYRQKIEL